MRPASEIVEAMVREVLASAGDTVDAIDCRASEFLQAANEATLHTLQRDIAFAVAARLFALTRTLTLQRFTL